jgi:2-iminobutanoate/2-iminopropanoate deaminase
MLDGDREEIRVESLSEPLSHYADAVRAGRLLFVSGCAPLDDAGRLVGDGDVLTQTRQVLANMREVLAAAGAEFAHVAKVTVFLTDVEDRQTVDIARREFFGSARPASTLVEVSRLAIEGMKVEIECVAVLPSQNGGG